MKTKVLVTTSSGPGAVGIFYALRNHPFKELILVAGNVDHYENIGWELADEKVTIPFATDQEFVPKMINLAIEHKIDVILPAHSNEIAVLAKNKKEFINNGIQLLLPPYDIVKKTHQKDLMFEILKGKNANYIPKFSVINSVSQLEKECRNLGYPSNPVCIKPARSSGGSRGFYIIDSKYDRYRYFFNEKTNHPVLDLEELQLKLKGLNEMPSLLVMEYIEGPEYGVDILAKDGQLIDFVVREWLPPYSNGMQLRNKIIEEPNISLDFLEKIVSDLQLTSILNCDIRLNNKNEPILLEINPRQSAYTGLASLKKNLLAASLDLILGEYESIDGYIHKDVKEVLGVRYWGEFAYVDDEITFL